MSLARLRTRQRVAAMFASIVMLLAVLAPTVSRALAASGHAGWIEVCTAVGMQWIQAAADTAEADDGLAGQDPALPGKVTLDHCPLCVLGAERMAPPPHMPPHVPTPVATAAVLAHYVSAALPVRTLWSAPARGPPGVFPVPLI